MRTDSVDVEWGEEEAPEAAPEAALPNPDLGWLQERFGPPQPRVPQPGQLRLFEEEGVQEGRGVEGEVGREEDPDGH